MKWLQQVRDKEQQVDTVQRHPQQEVKRHRQQEVKRHRHQAVMEHQHQPQRQEDMANNASYVLNNSAGGKMKKILVAVDDTKGTKNAFNMYTNACNSMSPENIILVYVEKLEGRSLMDDQLLSVSEMQTLKEALEGTDYQDVLDKKANAVVSYYRKALEDSGLKNIKAVIKKGHPAEEILATAKEEGADMIVIGSRSRETSRLFIGSVSREVANSSEIPVLLVK